MDPPLPFRAELVDGGQALRIWAPFSRDREVKVTLAKGLKSAKGVLTEPAEFVARFEGLPQSRLAFAGQGRYLSPKKDLYVRVVGREADFVRVQAWRVYENNLPALLNLSPILGQRLKAQAGLQMAKSVADFEASLAGLAGQSFERLLDLGELLPTKGGAYVVKATPICVLDDGKRAAIQTASGLYEYADPSYQSPYFDYQDYERSPQRYLPVVITDIGLSARVGPGQFRVWATSLATADSLPGVAVKFYDKANQVVFAGVTGREGTLWANVDAKEVAFLTAEKGGDLTYLLLGDHEKEAYEQGFSQDDEDDHYGDGQNGPAFNRWLDSGSGYLPADRGPGRPFLAQGYEAFLFLPRDVFKPGEKFGAKALVRDKKLNPPKETFPLLWRVVDANGRAVDEGRAEVGPNGSLDFTATLPFSIRVGPAEAILSVPGQGELARAAFAVEDFQPPRLAISLDPKASAYHGPAPDIEAEAQAAYLFGAAGEGLDWEATVRATTGTFEAPGFLGFDFRGPKAQPYAALVREIEGALGPDGRATLAFKLDRGSDYLPNLVDLAINFQVKADSGRWEGLRKVVPWFPRPYLIGFKAPDQAQVGAEAVWAVAAVDGQGQPADLPSLSVAVSQVRPRHYTEVRYGRVYRQTTEELIPVFSAEVPLAEGLATAAFTPAVAGTYEISVTAPGGSEVFSRRIEATGLAPAGAPAALASPLGDRVTLTLDKASYRPGETATVAIETPFPGNLWLTLETDEILWSRIVKAPGQPFVMKVPVPADLAANAQLTAALARPVGPKETAFLAQGRVSLEKDRSLDRLNVAVEAGEAKPDGELRVAIRLTDGQGRPTAGEATVALVDEGILSLTGYRVPNPGDYFGQSRSLISHFYDLRDLLLPVEEKVWPFLAPGGGDERSGLFSPFQRRQELLSLFLPTVAIGPSGQGEAVLKIPEYSGRGRLTVVAARGPKFGLTEETVAIARDLTVEPALPLAVAPGDSFATQVRVYLAPEAEAGLAELSVELTGPLSLLEGEGFSSGDGKLVLDLKPGESRLLDLKLLAAPARPGADSVGPAELAVVASFQGETFSQLAATVVRPPFPRVSRTLFGALAGGEESLELPINGLLPGTVSASLALAAGPWASANRAAEYLSEYPYGCLEQTVSRAWGFLSAPELGALTPTQATAAKEGLSWAVKRLATMQAVQGGLAFWPNQGDVYEWGTAYAAHFLTEAKNVVELPDGLLADALGYLRNYLSSQPRPGQERYALATKAYALYVLALNEDYQAGWVNALKERAQGLTAAAGIHLAAAESLSLGSSSPLFERERAPAPLSVPDLGLLRSTFDSPARDDALALMAWASVDPLAPRTRDLAAKVAQEGAQGHWSNTQENAQALWGLASYLKRSRAANPFLATVKTAEGVTLATLSDQGQTALTGPELVAALKGPLALNVSGPGRPWYSAVVAGVPVQAPAPTANGLELHKTWILGDEKVSLSDPGEPPEVTVWRGWKIDVEIRLSAPEPLQNVAIVDLVPGGLEVVNSRLADEGEEPPAVAELREDRLVMIVPELGPQGVTLKYALRAVTAGDFVLPPTVAEAMYQPDKQAITPTGGLKVLNRSAAEMGTEREVEAEMETEIEKEVEAEAATEAKATSTVEPAAEPTQTPTEA
ncbi:MAG: hypothetical protein LBE01_03225, partial [Deltaproteobacteria bacterium]|nr:hypothetical protein [Deltaproteobacteria bacterium]